MKKELEQWQKEFRKRNIRCTSKRLGIMKVMVNNDSPLSAQEIFQKVKKEFSEIRLSTVYRNLNFLEEKDIVRKIGLNIDNRENKFELYDQGHSHHHYLICLECGEIIPLECPLQNFKEKVKSETDYKMVDHNLKMYGICPACKEKSDKNCIN